MISTWVAAASFALAAVPAGLFRRNLDLYLPPPEREAEGRRPAVSVLIPARDEERVIGAAVRAALASAEGIEVEVVVLDDGSRDRTREIVQQLLQEDARVRLEDAPSLPEGWCGKQHACATLSRLARHPVLVFQDADVRLQPRALARMVAFLGRSGADLASGFPQQETETWLERLLIPLIHFVLLGFLPVDRMRKSADPAFSAGCGQLFIAHAGPYHAVGGHGAIRRTLHDGLRLPRAYRQAGRHTDLFDATDAATCRMYRSAREVWFGLAKNAREGLGAPGRIVPITVLLFVGQVLPFVLLALGAAGWMTMAGTVWAALAVGAAYAPRLLALRRFRQPLGSALLHPVGVLLLLGVQWFALWRHAFGRPATWKGRAYAGEIP